MNYFSKTIKLFLSLAVLFTLSGLYFLFYWNDIQVDKNTGMLNRDGGVVVLSDESLGGEEDPEGAPDGSGTSDEGGAIVTQKPESKNESGKRAESEELTISLLPENQGEESATTTEPLPWEGFIDDRHTLVWARGILGNSVFFGRGDDWFNCGNSDSINLLGAVNMTVSGWIKQDESAPDYVKDILFKGRPSGRWGSATLRDSKMVQAMVFQFDDSKFSHSVGGKMDFADGEWHQFAFVFEYQNKQVFKDGAWESIREWKATPYFDGTRQNELIEDVKSGRGGDVDFGAFNNNSYPLILGKCSFQGDPSSGPCYNYDGYLDELYMYSKALNDSEIEELYQRAKTGDELSGRLKDELIAYYPFDEGSGKATRDLSGNENHCVMDG